MGQKTESEVLQSGVHTVISSFISLIMLDYQFSEPSLSEVSKVSFTKHIQGPCFSEERCLLSPTIWV